MEEMTLPTYNDVREYAKTYSIVPIYREIFSDMKTPISLLRTLAANSPQHYLFESVEGGKNWARYSFLGFDPILELRCKDYQVEIKKGDILEKRVGNPDDVIREILKQYQSPKLKDLPPFTGGFVGYFSYEYMKYHEQALNFQGIDKGDFQDIELMLFNKVIAFDHFKQKMVVIVNIPTCDLEANYAKGTEQLQEMVELILSEQKAEMNPLHLKTELQSNFTKENYEAGVRKLQHHIHEGDIFQAVFSNQQRAEATGSLFHTYRVLRTTNPSPYMVYMKTSDVEIACSSPETLVRLQDGILSTFPIAGTRPRGKTPEADDKLIEQLLADPKELSEHHMLVDLARNDLGKISEFGSMQVKNPKEILKFSHVLHIATTVTGKIKAGLDALHAIGATLPAGTLSGAPKIRACEWIDQLEGTRRGVYGGAIGYIDFTGNMDTCIAIRLAVKKDDYVYVQSGAGIVKDSVPEKEFEECNNKAGAIVEALKISEGMFEE